MKKTDTARIPEHVKTLNTFYIRYAKENLGIDRPIVKITPNEDTDGIPDVSIAIIDGRKYVETGNWNNSVVFKIDIELKAGIEARVNIYRSQVSNETKMISIFNNTTDQWYLIELNLQEYQDTWKTVYDKSNQFKIYFKNILNNRRSIDCNSYRLVATT